MWLVPVHVIILDPVAAASERRVDGPGVHDRVPQRAVPYPYPYASPLTQDRRRVVPQPLRQPRRRQPLRRQLRRQPLRRRFA